MKRCKVYECKRRALGMSQTDVAKLAGVSAPTVSTFERDGEVSALVANAIIRAIDDKLKSLERKDYMEVMLMMSAIQLPELEDGDEKLRCLTYISLYANKLQLEILNEQRN